MKYTITLLYIFIPFFGYSQLQPKDSQLLSELLVERINNLRTEQHIENIVLDDNLALAADFHSQYMARVNRLSHKQASRKYKTPQLRVLKFSDAFELVGENILFITHKKKKYTPEILEELADEMFKGWKESPEHYKNMIYPNYKLAGFGFTKGKEGKIYATNVFGAKGIIIDGQQSDNAFNIQEGTTVCNDFLRDKRNIVANIGNSVEIEGNQIVFYYHNKKMLEKLFVNERDGLAIDLITRDQLNCESNNILDMSAIYDGVMLKPLYKTNIFKNNIAEGDFRLITPLATIPNEFKNKEFQPSVIYIKDGKRCAYTIPTAIPRNSYSLVDIAPKIKTAEQYPFYTTGLVASNTHYFNFNRSAISPDSQIKVDAINGKLKNVTICSFSSIEGDSIVNKKLQRDRAKFIENHIKDKISNHVNIPFLIKTDENWETMLFQLELLELENVAQQNRSEIKKYVATDSLHNWDSLLYIQRKSYATIEFEGRLNPKDSLFFEQNLITALKNKNWNVANRALSKLIEKKQYPDFVFDPPTFKILSSQTELAQNTAALLTNTYFKDYEKAVIFLRHWINHENELTLDAKYNLSILYCKVVSHLLYDWDLNAKIFAKLITPQKIEPIINLYTGNEKYSKLILNYHLTSIEYYGQTNNYEHLNKSFNYITNYFKNIALDIEDEIDLCLFFNNWSMYNLTIEYLHKRMKQQDFTEDAAFILAHTCMAFPNRLSTEETEAVMERAFRFNQERWCNWINYEFQHLRNPKVKLTFCEECKDRIKE